MKFKDRHSCSRELAQMSSSNGNRGRSTTKPLSSTGRASMKRDIRRKARRRLTAELADATHQEGRQ